MNSCLPAAYLLAAGGGLQQLLPACCVRAGCMGGRDRLHERLPAWLLPVCWLQGGFMQQLLPACLLPACWLDGGEGQVA